MSGRLMLTLVAIACLAGCDKKEPDPQDPPSGEVRVSPGDRLGWTQPASDLFDISLIQFALYVDGARTPLAGAACARAGTAFECNAVLPALAPGTHTLELAAFVADGSQTAESARSAPLRVVAGGLTTGSVSAGSTLVVTAEGAHLRLTRLAGGLSLVSDVVFAPDGTALVAERGGVVRLVKDGAAVERPALDLGGEVGLPAGGLLGLALDRGYGETGFVYALYAATGPRGGLEFVLARFRHVGGQLAERAVLLSRIPASPEGASGALRFGPDGKLYVALDSAADGRVAGSFATYNGKVLRLNTDATTPDDQPGLTPIFSLEHPLPFAMDWQPSTGYLWVIDRLERNGGRLSAVTGDPPQPRVALRTSYALPDGTGATSGVFYRGALMPMFTGDLFVAAESARELVRLRFDPDDPRRIVSVERMLTGAIGAIRVVAEGPDGALYLATDSELYRLGT